MKIKYIALLIIVLLLTGCFKDDSMEDIDVITTIYPIEYIANRLYGQSSTVKSIYPKNIDVTAYKLTDKQMRDFSKNDLFIYNGNSFEREYATELLSYNKNMKIIDSSYGVDTTYSDYEIWLNPSNMLMMVQNVRNALQQYVTNPYTIEEIKNQYELLKVDISALETEFKKTADNSVNKTIICYDETLNFLQKYGFTVINVTEKGKNKEVNIDLAKSLLKNKTLSYIFVSEKQGDNALIKDIVSAGATKINFYLLETISEDKLITSDDYLSIMHENINLIKKETYN